MSGWFIKIMLNCYVLDHATCARSIFALANLTLNLIKTYACPKLCCLELHTCLCMLFYIEFHSFQNCFKKNS